MENLQTKNPKALKKLLDEEAKPEHKSSGQTIYRFGKTVVNAYNTGKVTFQGEINKDVYNKVRNYIEVIDNDNTNK